MSGSGSFEGPRAIAYRVSMRGFGLTAMTPRRAHQAKNQGSMLWGLAVLGTYIGMWLIIVIAAIGGIMAERL